MHNIPMNGGEGALELVTLVEATPLVVVGKI